MAKRCKKASGGTDGGRPAQLEHSRPGRVEGKDPGSGRQMPHRGCRHHPAGNKKPVELSSDVLSLVLEKALSGPVGLPLFLSSDTVKTFP